MKKKAKLIIGSTVMLAIMFISFDIVYGASIIEWWQKATIWYKNGSSSIGLPSGVFSGISEIVEVVGTAIIAIATVIVGIKYIFGTVQGKVEARESMLNLVVACIFFFGWSSISGLIIEGNTSGSGTISGKTTKLSFFNGDLTLALASVFNLISMVGKIIAILVIAYLGIKYIYAGAEAKAMLKKNSPALILGVILIFCTTTFLGVVANVLTDIL